ncbi:MAG: peptidylprolyl isomerase [Desulfobacterales bacterium]|nr:peptidylprolyl isomerase [Desulfobacterales bacterium]
MSGLIHLRGREADALCLTALERDDYQLILTAVGGLKGSSSASKAVPALVSALARLTARRKETSRDPRLAILERLGELGTKDQAAALAPYTEDFDPAVATAAADLVARWTGKRPDIHPRPLPVSFPRLADLDKLRSAKVRVTMAEGGAFEMALSVDEAPATVARFAALVRSRYYDGLTIHRIVPNFLVQGGSPGANEFMGDARFMRDESGLASNVRGTVGISTRGRDTGDAQIYINTVDNDRLDHDYCVFARVTSGMEVVDRILESDVIERIEILSEENQ